MNEKEFNRDEYISECYATPAHNVRRPHKHAELIKAWADGAEIEYRRLESWGMRDWELVSDKLMVWYETDVHEYRIKPEPKPDVVLYSIVHRVSYGLPCSPYASMSSAYAQPPDPQTPANLKLTFDGETGELKSAEVLK